MIRCSWTGNNYIFIMSTIADRSEWAIRKICFITWARNIIHQNWFLITIRKVTASTIRQTSNICPANGSKFRIKRSAKNISCRQVEFWIITNCSPVSTIKIFCSSLPSSLRNIFQMIHSISSISILRNKWWILCIKICF